MSIIKKYYIYFLLTIFFRSSAKLFESEINRITNDRYKIFLIKDMDLDKYFELR